MKFFDGAYDHVQLQVLVCNDSDEGGRKQEDVYKCPFS
jgi:hypothetical protein